MADLEVGPGLWVRLGLDSSGFQSGMQQAQGSVLSFYRDVTVSLNMTMQIFDQVLGYGQKFIDLANQASELVSTLDKLSVTTGLNNEELQRWSNVSRYADSDISTLSASLRKLQLNLNDSGEEGQKARKILDSMRVSYKNVDGSLKSLNELFPDTIEGIKNLSSSADKVTAANTLFGRSYQELAGYMTMSKSEMEGYYNSANVLTDAQTQKLRDYEQATKDLAKASSDLGRTAGAEVAPGLTSVYDALTDIETGLSKDTPLINTLNDSLVNLAMLLNDSAASMETLWIVTSAFNKGELFTPETYDKLEKIATRTNAENERIQWNYQTSQMDLSQSGQGITDYSNIITDANGNIIGKKSSSSTPSLDLSSSSKSSSKKKPRSLTRSLNGRTN
jgi:chromosome segregation ATPase